MYHIQNDTMAEAIPFQKGKKKKKKDKEQ